MRERFIAWFVTGPLGHFVSGAADWLAALRAAAVVKARSKPQD